MDTSGYAQIRSIHYVESSLKKWEADEKHALDESSGRRRPTSLRTDYYQSWSGVDTIASRFQRPAIVTLYRSCRELTPVVTDAGVIIFVSENSSDTDAVIYTDGFVRH